MTRTRRLSARTWRLVAALALVAAAVGEAAFRLDAPWPGFPPTVSRAVSLFLCVAWLGTAVAAWPRGDGTTMGRGTALLLWIAPFLLIEHSFVTMLVSQRPFTLGGAFYLPIAVLVGYATGAALSAAAEARATAIPVTPAAPR